MRGDLIAVAECPREVLRPVGIGPDRQALAAEGAVPGHDRGRWIRLRRRMAQAAGVDLEGRAALDEGPQDRLVQLGLLREALGEHVRVQVALHDVDVADRVEEPGASRGLDLVEGWRHDLRERPARDPARDVRGVVWRHHPVVDRPDGEVVGVPPQVLADVRLPRAVVGELDAEPDRDALRTPALRGVADDPLAVGEGRIAERRSPGLEVEVIGDRQLADAEVDRLLRVDVDRDVAVGRQVGVEMGVQREAAAAAVLGHPPMRPSSWPTRSNASRARSSCESACAAVTIVRIRARSMATVGKTTGWAKTPSSMSRRREAPGGVGVAHHHRCDRRLGPAGVEAEPGELRLEAARVRPEPLEELRLVLHDPDRLAAGGDDRRGDGWSRRGTVETAGSGSRAGRCCRPRSPRAPRRPSRASRPGRRPGRAARSGRPCRGRRGRGPRRRGRRRPSRRPRRPRPPRRHRGAARCPRPSRRRRRSPRGSGGTARRSRRGRARPRHPGCRGGPRRPRADRPCAVPSTAASRR